MRTSELGADRLVALAYAFRNAKALLSAVELDVFTTLAGQPLGKDELRSRIGLHERGARDFFDTLVALGLLERDQAGVYANAPDSDHYLDREKASYIGGLLEHLGTREYPHWGMLTAALRTGEPQSQRSLSNGSLFEDELALEVFVKGMTGGSLPAAQALAAKFPWQDYASVVDIGTAEGCLPVQVALKHAHIEGCGFDRTPVKQFFDSYVRVHGLGDRVRFSEGDFFSDPLPLAEVMVLGRVLHNWDLETKRMLLSKAYEALPAGGALIVYERLIDDERRTNTPALLSSLNMLVMTSGGFDFTAGDCVGWMQTAGFRDCRSEPLTHDISMIVAVK